MQTQGNCGKHSLEHHISKTEIPTFNSGKKTEDSRKSTNATMRANHPQPIEILIRYALSLFCIATIDLSAQAHSRGLQDLRLRSFDELMDSFIEDPLIPGAALAIANKGKLIFARAYGWANESKGKPVLPDSLFRIASLSKPITAAAILHLAQEKRLQLDDKAIDHLYSSLGAAISPLRDKRISQISIRQLLNHTAGFDRHHSFDPMFRSRMIQRELKLTTLPTAVDIIRYVLGRELDFSPGQRYAYSNIGYNILGRIIERSSSMAYEDYVQSSILRPMSITGMRLGATSRNERSPREVTYSDHRSKSRSIFEDSGSASLVSRPYGAWHLEAMDAHGGWIASAIDLVRFADLLLSKNKGPLKPSFRTQIQSRPASPVGINEEGELNQVYYGYGWSIRKIPGKGVNLWHTGLLDGSATILVKRHDGLTWAALFNSRSGTGEERQNLALAIDPFLHQAAAKVAEWPTEKDLFPLYLDSKE